MFPDNLRGAAPMVAPKLLPLHQIGAAVGIHRDDASDQTVVVARAMVEVRGQKSDLARHHAMQNEVDGDDVLLSLVAKDQLLMTKHHHGSLHHLRSAAGVAGTRAAPVVRRRPDDVSESPHQTLEHNSTTGGHGGGNCPLHRHHRDPLGNGLLAHWRGGVLYRIAQGGKTRLLATIDGCRPGGRRHTGTRHDEVALGALRCAHLTVAARAIVVGAPHSHPIISEGEAMVGGDLL